METDGNTPFNRRLQRIIRKVFDEIAKMGAHYVIIIT